ncbi:MAG: hypothetical protein ACYTEZ_14460 [Planctomycetota bacterium]|jgi:cytochrome c5
MGKLLLSTLPALLLGAACVTTTAGRSLETALAQAETDAERGRILYERACSRCHNLRMPRSHSADEWKHYVRKYGRRARLAKEHRALVYEYLSRNARD